MKIYMAGAVSGNLASMWSRIAKELRCHPNRSFDEIHDEEKARFISEDMNVYLASPHTYPDLMAAEVAGDKKAFLNNTDDVKGILKKDKREYSPEHPFILESFYYANDDTERLIPYFGDFLLDSGAFTFMQNSKSHCDFDEYLERYADFINRNNVKKFFELDIDSVVGYTKVKEYRKRLERLTGRQCIPVWHKSRGKEEFLRMCDEYSYVALGGVVIKEISKTEYKYFPWFIKEAHKRNTKIHGLGFTNLNGIIKYHFDSVDSTAWTAGNRFGFLYKFNGTTMVKINPPKGNRIIKPREAAINNFNEWVKFQQYALTHL